MRWWPLILIPLLGGFACGGKPPDTPFGDDVPFRDLAGELAFSIVTEQGGRVDWSHARDRIAFDRMGEDGYADIWLMDPSGADQVCLTCDHAVVPQRHNGQPVWHPDGEWIVFQAEDAESGARPKWSNPGRGVNNDLWIMRADGSEARVLVDLPLEKGRGLLHPHFSADGGRLLWGEMYEKAKILTKRRLFGSWRLVAAELVFTSDGPALENRVEHRPGEPPAFYENHGLSPDGSEWIFSANLDLSKKRSELNDIYLMDATTGEDLRRFTTGGYNEHASFSPNGERVLWMSSAGTTDRGTEWWLARPDGSDLLRLTGMNDSRRPRDNRSIAADASFNADGTAFVGYVQQGVGGDAGWIVRVSGLPTN